MVRRRSRQAAGPWSSTATKVNATAAAAATGVQRPSSAAPWRLHPGGSPSSQAPGPNPALAGRPYNRMYRILRADRKVGRSPMNRDRRVDADLELAMGSLLVLAPRVADWERARALTAILLAPVRRPRPVQRGRQLSWPNGVDFGRRRAPHPNKTADTPDAHGGGKRAPRAVWKDRPPGSGMASCTARSSSNRSVQDSRVPIRRRSRFSGRNGCPADAARAYRNGSPT
jgi:hypothetical protein